VRRQLGARHPRGFTRAQKPHADTFQRQFSLLNFYFRHFDPVGISYWLAFSRGPSLFALRSQRKIRVRAPPTRQDAL
jgi:hypothetical protein